MNPVSFGCFHMEQRTILMTVALTVFFSPIQAFSQTNGSVDTVIGTQIPLHDDNPKPQTGKAETPKPIDGPASAPAAKALPRMEGAYLVDEQGRRLRVAFDPTSRLFLRAGWSMFWGPGSGNDPADVQLGIGLDLGGGCSLRSEDCWKVRHRMFHADFQTRRPESGGAPWIQGFLYHAELIRFMEHPSLTIPATRPITLSLPFNFGLDVKVGGLAYPWGGSAPGWELQLVDAHVLADFSGSPVVGEGLLLGVGARYDIELRDSNSSTQVEHRVAPLTEVLVQYRYVSPQGHHVIVFEGQMIPCWSSETGWLWQWEAEARYELVVAAINDLPVRLDLGVQFRRKPAFGQETPQGADWHTFAGLSWSVE